MQVFMEELEAMSPMSENLRHVKVSKSFWSFPNPSNNLVPIWKYAKGIYFLSVL